MVQDILLAVEDWSFLIHIAAFVTASGYFFRDQIILRSLIVFGSSTYVAYYYLVPEQPLWNAIMWSSIFVMVNIYVICRLIYDRMAVYENEQERHLSRTFNQFNPGMFRKLMAAGHLNKAYSVTRLSTEGKHLDRLYFVIDGGISIEKDGRQFDYMAGAFIGEVAYLTSMPASASVFIPENTSYVVWHHAALRSLASKHPELKSRLEAMFNQDMARKVQFA